MRRSLALLLLATLPAAAQQIRPSEIQDPANLMGERVSPPALADTLPINHGAPALEQLLRKLRTRASLMMIVAHPDDEDGGLLTLESRGAGARVAMLTLTRGEGGQNLMSADFDDALGLIRTQELLAEDRYTGVDQMFGTEVDFGFSKTKEETLQKWGHDRVLYDAVRAVRLYRPLVLASVFVGGVTDGHGHHQVAGEITQEVFNAAGDPTAFPEMGLPPWTPLKVYARTPFSPVSEKGMFDYATGRYSPVHFYNYVTKQWSNTTPASTVTIHEGDKPNIPAFNGMSYIQWARQGLALQKTQIGPNVRIPPPGVADVGYTLMGSHPECPTDKSPDKSPRPIRRSLPAMSGATSKANPTENQDLFTGIDTTFPALAQLAPSAPKALGAVLTVIDNQTAEAQRLYDPAHLELTAPPLRRALSLLDNLIKDTESSPLPPNEKFNLLHELRIKRVQCNNALVLALGLSFEVTFPADAVLTSQAQIEVSTKLTNGGREKVALSGLLLPTASVPQNQIAFADNILASGSTAETPAKFELTGSQPATRPYFYRKSLEQPYYDIADPQLRNAAMTPAPFVATARVWNGTELEIATITHVPVSRNTTLQTTVVVPPVAIAVLPSSGIFPLAKARLNFTTILNPFRLQQKLPSLNLPTGWTARIAPIDPLPPEGSVLSEDWEISTAGVRSGGTYAVRAVVQESGHDYTEGYRPVGYPGLTYTNYYTPAAFKATAVDVTTAPNLHIAYLPGTGDTVPQFLPSLGVTPTILTVADLTPATLSKYDAIVLGVRAYSAHPELQGTGSQPLLDYAKQGGIVISQYMSGGFNPASAPFPLDIPGDSAHNVVDEAQPVTLLQPQSPLLTWPNKITPADFNNWVAERGHGFASDWAPEYQPLLETHDPDQDPQKGGLLVAKVGKGAYIYCALALYRQLPEGVPGAYRLLANLLSYAKNPSR